MVVDVAVISCTNNRRAIIMVAHEWIEGAELHPASAQLLGGIEEKSAHVGSYEGNPKHLEVQHH